MYKRAYYWRNKKMMPPAGTGGINKTGNQEQKDKSMINFHADHVNILRENIEDRVQNEY